MNKSLFGAAILVFALVGAGRASDIIYDVELTSGAASITGFIETDGTIGALSTVNFLDWNLEVNDGTSTFDQLGPLEPGTNSRFINNGGSIGSSTALTFDTSTVNDNYILFQTLGAGNPYVCVQDQSVACTDPPAGVVWNANRDTPDPNASIASDGVTTIGTAEDAVPEPSTLMMMFAALGISPLLRKRIVSSSRSVTTKYR